MLQLATDPIFSFTVPLKPPEDLEMLQAFGRFVETRCLPCQTSVPRKMTIYSLLPSFHTSGSLRGLCLTACLFIQL